MYVNRILFESIKPIAANLFLYSPFQYPAGSSKDDGYNNTNINKLSPAQSTPTVHAISALVSPADKIDIFSAGEKKRRKKRLLSAGYHSRNYKGRTIRKVMWGRAIFEPQEFFFVIKFLV